MAQFTSSKTTGGGTVVNTVVDPTTNIATYTVTAPNGAVATVSQNATGGLSPSTVASIKQQLAQGGADAQTSEIGLTAALSQTTSRANDQAATATPGVQETSPIPASTASDPEVPQPENKIPPVPYVAPTSVDLTDEQRAQLAETNTRIADRQAADPNFYRPSQVDQDIARARAAGEIPPEQPLTAQEQANVDALNRIEANRANPVGSDGFPTPAENLASLREEGFGPAPVTAQEQANEDAINRIEANRANPVEASEDPFEQARLDAEQQLDTAPTEQAVIDAGQDAKLSQEEQGQLREFQAQQRTILAAENVPAEPSGPLPSVSTTANTVVGVPVANLVAEARKQQTLRNLTQNKAQTTDWRVKLRLAPNSTYLYNDPSDPGILSPLSAKTGTDGVIFPYTPAIETAYKANYDQYDLTHSNYRGYFYKNSYVDAINMRCTFTAQDTSEANYLLAVIHFFRSVTKMFYGQDSQRGSPPPLVFLSGLGNYQFNEHPCVVSQFNYTLPPDVDYVRAYSALDMSTNLLDNRTRTTVSGNPLSYGINRVLNSGLFPGAKPAPKASNNLEVKQPTYVPTKMEISISLLPMQSRQQVSTQFSLKGFANGNLLKGGFW